MSRGSGKDKVRTGKGTMASQRSALKGGKSPLTAKKYREVIFLVAGAAIIVLGNFLLKYLELSNLHRNGLFLSDFFTSVNSKAYLLGLLDNPWKLLLPVEISPAFMRWTTTGLIPVSALNFVCGIDATFYLLNTLLIITSLLASWFVFRSKIFSFTLAICMGFGTQFIHAYNNSSVVILYLFVIYLEINLLAFYYVFKSRNHPKLFKTIFILSLIALALCWEMWVDYLVFLVICSLFLYLVFSRRKKEVPLQQTKFILLSSLCIGLSYFLVKFTYSSGVSEHLARGSEGETVLTYVLNNHSIAYVIMAIEDVISNIITYNYIALTNYLPPFLLPSNSLFYLGRDAIISNQYGYAATYGAADFVYNHHVFLWYFYAGILVVVFCYFLVKYMVQSFKKPTSHSLILAALLLLIATGSFTHLLIKYRFYLSLPLFSYKCIVSTVGVSLLIAYLLMYLRNRISSNRIYFPIIAISWLIIVYAGFSRPELLSNMLTSFKMGIYPDPLKELNIMLGGLF